MIFLSSIGEDLLDVLFIFDVQQLISKLMLQLGDWLTWISIIELIINPNIKIYCIKSLPNAKSIYENWKSSW